MKATDSPVRAIAALAALLLCDLATGGDRVSAEPATSDWPQYRGVRRDGVASGGGLGSAWPEGGPRLAWKVPLGGAFSQLVVHGDAVFTGASSEDEEILVRLDGNTGKEVWRTPVGELFTDSFGAGPRSTPTVDGARVFFLSAKGTLLAVRTRDGSTLWRVDLTDRFGAQVPRFGFSGSPLIVDELLLVEVGGGDDAALVAFDKKSGETRWSVLSGPAGYGSAIVTEIAGVRQVVLVRLKTVTSVDLDGKVLWTHDLEEAAIAMPVALGDGRVFVSAMGDTGCVMLRIEKTESGFAVHEQWKNREMRNHFNSSVVHDGHVYGFDNATLKCLSADTGEVMWAKRGFGKGSVIVSGDRLVVLSDQGLLVLAEATPEGYRELGSIQALEGRSWTAPSFSAGRVYLRNLTETVCLDLRG